MAHGSSTLLFSRQFPGGEAVRQLSRVAPPFVAAVFSRKGMLSRQGRILIRGKFRRLLICSVPLLARYLRTHYRLEGGCNNCGASCNLLFRCPHWDTDSRLCTVYESRPRVCRMFPITPSDLRDRNLALRHTVCGFQFAAGKQTGDVQHYAVQDSRSISS
jgi:putative zinc- or iron-chelating protein